jgi:hypothetical protein
MIISTDAEKDYDKIRHKKFVETGNRRNVFQHDKGNI